MRALTEFTQNMDWVGLLSLLISAVSVLFCITFHELSHGFIAYKLGDPTAKNMGRLTLNPFRHLDPIGFLSMLVAGVGWAKPVPVDMRYFKRPKRDMALTSLAGPASNLLVTAAAVAVCALLYRFAPMERTAVLALFGFLCNIAIMSVGMGLFNLLPISPLDGSKILFSMLPNKIYGTILRYERYVMPLLLALMFFGVFSKPLSFCINWVLNFLCGVVGLPWEAFVVGSRILEFLLH